ncbi:hybrid sensor histidine kinase/response regulator [Sesbania bispinosa]|nr:hybrid sensor histidine kinase/response regulator [Sesbania bispinosa]
MNRTSTTSTNARLATTSEQNDFPVAVSDDEQNVRRHNTAVQWAAAQRDGRRGVKFDGE